MPMIDGLFFYIAVSKLNFYFLSETYYDAPLLMLKQVSQDRERFGHLLTFRLCDELYDTFYVKTFEGLLKSVAQCMIFVKYVFYMWSMS